MKIMKRHFYKQGITVVAICLVLFALPFLLAKCSKDTKKANVQDMALQEFIASPIYKGFIGSNVDMGKVKVDAARIVKMENNAAVVHIPVMKHANIEGAIIGLPTGTKGKYELMYQDNRAALSGTGNIFLYTSANELFGKIVLKERKIEKFESTPPPVGNAYRQNEAILDDCNFRCRLDKCYNEMKARFPGEAFCAVLDIFMGVCSSATLATCLIKMATK